MFLLCVIAMAIPSFAYSQKIEVGGNQYQSQGNPRISLREGSVFVPIEKYIRQGDVQCLSAWFADNLQISMIGKLSNCSKSQARQILKHFFAENPPQSFEIVYRSGSYPMQCAVGNFSGGGYDYSITIIVKTNENGSFVEQIKISRK